MSVEQLSDRVLDSGFGGACASRLDFTATPDSDISKRTTPAALASLSGGTQKILNSRKIRKKEGRKKEEAIRHS